jgi:Holliday junction resolvase
VRRAAKVDDNQKEIVQAYREFGFSVVSCAAIGGGFPDLAVGIYGVTDLVEVKDGEKTPSQRKLRPLQVEFFDNWKGSVRVVNNIEDVAAHYEERKREYYGK